MSRVRAGVVAAMIVAVSAVAALIWIPRDDRQPMVVTAQFEDTIGLYTDNTVAVLGMPVGRVTAIVPRGGYVEVELEIDDGVDIPADVQAVTISTSILTDRHVELTPVYRGGPTLENGDVLGLARTRTPVEFDRTLAMVDKLGRSLGGDSQGQGPLADLIGVGAQITTGSGPDIKATLDRLSQALRLSADNGAASKRDIQAIVTNLADLTQTAAENDTAIREFSSNVRQLSEILADQNLGTGSTGAKINQILDQAASLLEDNRDGLKGTVADFTTLTTAISDMRREMSELLDLFPLTVENIYNAIDMNAGTIRTHALVDKLFLNGQLTKEICNLLGRKDLECSTGTLADYGPDFGITGLLELMAGVR